MDANLRWQSGLIAVYTMPASAEGDEKPKRRRTYTRKKESADSGEQADGVMKTLARGADEVVAEAE